MKDLDADGHVGVDGPFIMHPLSFDEQWFRGLFEAHYQDLLAYAVRRLRSFEDAEDVVAEVYAVAWRRRAIMPDEPEEQRMWLYGVARRALANVDRTHRRRGLLTRRLFALNETTVPDHVTSDDQSDQDDAFRALGALRHDDQEILLLSLWEELSVTQIASVLGLTSANVSVRLHRAKARLRREFLRQVQDPTVGGHVDETGHTGMLPGKEHDETPS